MQASVKLVGTQLVIRQLDALDGKVRLAATQALSRGMQYAAGVSQRSFLRGPRPAKLGVVTGRLFGSITSRTTDEGDRIVGAIGTNVPYGRFHEEGFHGTQSVRSHTRVVRQISGGGKLIAGRIGDIGTPAPVRASKAGAAKQKGGLVEFGRVSAHTRTLNYAGKPFLKPALQATLPRILREVRTAVETALKTP